MKPTLLVMAAGIGSRYGGLKQIDPVGPSGEIVIDYSIYDAIRAGFGKVVFVIRKSIEQPFKEVISDRLSRHVDVQFAYQELNEALPAGMAPGSDREKPWGTGHAVLVAEKLIHEPFAVINADDFYGVDTFKVLHDFLDTLNVSCSPAEYGMVGFRLRNTLSPHGSVGRGVCRVNSDGYLQGLREITTIEKDGEGARYMNEEGASARLSGDEIVSMNTWGFEPSLFAHLRREFEEFLKSNMQNNKSEYFLPSLVDDLVHAGVARVKVLPTNSSWFGVTYREDRPAVQRSISALVEEGVYPTSLWS